MQMVLLTSFALPLRMNTEITDSQLVEWVQRLSPNVYSIAVFEGKIQKWKDKKDNSNNPYDTEICGFHIESLQAQIDLINCELKAQDSVKNKDLVLLREHASKHTVLSEEVSKQRIRIYSAEQVDLLVGKGPLRI